MFGWFRNWAARRRRNLFQFFDGTRYRRADPWVIYRQLYNDDEFVIGKEPNDPADMLTDAMNLEEPAFSKCVACGHRALGTQPFDGKRGLSEVEVVSVVADFLVWIDALLKKNGTLSISLPPTASISSPGPECPADPTSSPLSSTSMPTGSIPAEPSSSSTA